MRSATLLANIVMLATSMHTDAATDRTHTHTHGRIALRQTYECAPDEYLDGGQCHTCEEDYSYCPFATVTYIPCLSSTSKTTCIDGNLPCPPRTFKNTEKVQFDRVTFCDPCQPLACPTGTYIHYCSTDTDPLRNQCLDTPPPETTTPQPTTTTTTTPITPAITCNPEQYIEDGECKDCTLADVSQCTTPYTYITCHGNSSKSTCISGDAPCPPKTRKLLSYSATSNKVCITCNPLSCASTDDIEYCGGESGGNTRTENICTPRPTPTQTTDEAPDTTTPALQTSSTHSATTTTQTQHTTTTPKTTTPIPSTDQLLNEPDTTHLTQDTQTKRIQYTSKTRVQGSLNSGTIDGIYTLIKTIADDVFGPTHSLSHKTVTVPPQRRRLLQTTDHTTFTLTGTLTPTQARERNATQPWITSRIYTELQKLGHSSSIIENSATAIKEPEATNLRKYTTVIIIGITGLLAILAAPMIYRAFYK